MDRQKEQERQELIEVVEEDWQHIINYLKASNLKAKGNQITILFSINLEKSLYKQLWEINGKPDVTESFF